MPFKEVASSEIPEPKPVDVNFDKLDERPDGSKPRNLDRGVVTTNQAKPPSAGTQCVQSPKVLREAGVAKVLDAAISRTDQDNGSTEPAMRDVIPSWVSDFGNGLGHLFSELAT